MDALRDLESFMAVVEEGSLTKAARRLGRSLQAVSRSLQALERSHGTTLVARTTRTSHPSAAGMRFYERIKGALAELELARIELSEESHKLTGQLRVDAPSLFGPRYIAPIAAEFMQRHPGLDLTLELADDFRDPVEGGADITIRLGDTPDSRLVARRLGSIRRVAFAAPSYLASHGWPRHPQDLAGHECVVRTGVPHSSRWSFKTLRGEDIAVNVSGRFHSDHVAAVNAVVVSGLGVGLAAFWQIRDLLDTGQVELVLPEYEPPPLPLHALWPRTRKLPARTRLLIDLLVARLASERL